MKDENKAKVLVDYLEKLGVDKRTIICTSVESYSPRVGEDIVDYLKEKIKEESIFIYIATEEYFSSSFCLNEMGAAWVTIDSKNHFIFKAQEFDLSLCLLKTVIKTTLKYTEFNKDGFSSLFEFLKERNYVSNLDFTRLNSILSLVNC